MNSITTNLLGRLRQVAKVGDGWKACCPAHEDHNPSLSITEASDRVLIRCFAGCSPQAVVEAVGMSMSDLFIDTRNAKPAKVTTTKAKGKTFATPEAAITELSRKLGTPTAQWTYHDDHGQPVGVVVRWDTLTGKEIRPVAKIGDGWIIGAMPEPRRLYGLPELRKLPPGSRVYVVEGEKCVEALRAIGLVATTSAGGSNAAKLTDWSPLGGHEIIIIPDHDASGEKYQDVVIAILSRLSPSATAKIIELPGLPEAGDVVDWMDAHDGAEPDALRAQLELMADEAPTVEPTRLEPAVAAYEPFPVETLPQSVCRFVVDAAQAIGCDLAYIALPLLTVFAAAIGNSRRIMLKRGWTEPAILWTVCVGESGNGKTPGFKLVMCPVRERQKKALDRYREAMEQHERKLAEWDRDFAEWKRKKKEDAGEPPPKPEPPIAERCIVSDTTVQALAPLLLENPRGLLLACDELASWFGSFDKFSKGKSGADASHWLSMHAAESIVVDRKTGIPRTIFVPLAAMCVSGGIQPGILHRAWGTEHRESGLAARLLLAYPPRKPKQWTEADIAPEREEEFKRLLDRLYELQPTQNEDGELRPVLLKLTPEAKREWIAFYNEHNQEHAELSGDLSAAWSKLEGYAARLALVIHCIRWATDDPTLNSADVVDATSIAAGVKLSRWFGREARRVYATLGESDDDREQRQLAEWVVRKGGAVSIPEVQRGHRRFKTSEEAEAALQGLVDAGFGVWQDVTTSPKGGRPSREFRLTQNVYVYETPQNSEENQGFVDVDSVDATENEPDAPGGWGDV
ncbi:MAG: DUF3987 domain-containing protein [Planctomycetales bacterium]|nr:DUF3987 domain-containing protein [Planctomycetales bacterium]